MKRRIRKEPRRFPGRFRMFWYTGAESPALKDEDDTEGVEKVGDRVEVGEATRGAVKTHVKALVVDGEVTVLGSCNADRASWWTSGEVGVVVLDKVWAEDVRRGLVKGLGGRWEEEEGMGELEEVEGSGRRVEEV